MSIKFISFCALFLTAGNSRAAQLVLCEIAYAEANGVTNFAGSYHKAGKFSVQDCAKEAIQAKLKVSTPVKFEFTHFTQTASIFTPGSGWKLSSKLEKEGSAPEDFTYAEF
ncbi:MAG TPA: hypothetical protein VNJ01_11320 [Bacteriovoracaceae bacterium]|nr:hypothetical protein [Bacteriovoracaceae bacterium]